MYRCQIHNTLNFSTFLSFWLVDANDYRVVCNYNKIYKYITVNGLCTKNIIIKSIYPRSHKHNFCVMYLKGVLSIQVGSITISSGGELVFNSAGAFSGLFPPIVLSSDPASTDDDVTVYIVVGITENPPISIGYAEKGGEAVASGDVFNGLPGYTPAEHLVTSFTIAGQANDLPVDVPTEIPGVGTITVTSAGTYTFTPEETYTGVVPVIEVEVAARSLPEVTLTTGEVLIVVGDETNEDAVVLQVAVGAELTTQLPMTDLDTYTIDDFPQEYEAGTTYILNEYSDAISTVPAGGTPRSGFVVGSNPTCVGVKTAKVHDFSYYDVGKCVADNYLRLTGYSYYDVGKCVGDKYTTVHNIKDDFKVNCINKYLYSLKYKYIEGDFNCIATKTCRIYNITGKSFVCIKNATILRGLYSKINSWYGCTRHITIYDIEKEELTVQYCVNSLIYSIDRNIDLTQVEFCPYPRLKIRSTAINADKSKNFCVTLKMPPPPGSED